MFSIFFFSNLLKNQWGTMKFCLSLFFLILLSCGPKPKQESLSFKKFEVGGTPIDLYKQDKECLSIFNADEIPSFHIPRFLNGTFAFVKMSFKGQLRDNYVLSPVKAPIAKSYYATTGLIDAKLKYNGQKYGHTQYWLRWKNKGSLLDVCPATNSYLRNSFESAGLSVSDSIHKAYQGIVQTGQLKQIAPIDVVVGAKIRVSQKFYGGRSHKTQRLSYMTDNAFYAPSEQKIVFLPQSEEEKASSANAPFWEIPMVAAHEYGHHVFHQVMSAKSSSALKIVHSYGCFKAHMDYKILYGKVGKKASAEFALGAINEAFADLISYYTLSEKESSLTKVQCFAKNRDVGSETFMDESLKEFSVTARIYMDSTYKFSDDRNCNTPNYQEIHDVGAIFAYQADQLLSQVLAEKEMKLKVLLKWLKVFAIKKSDFKTSSVSVYMFRSLELLRKLARDYLNEEFGAVDCQSLRRAFPYTSNDENYRCKYL